MSTEAAGNDEIQRFEDQYRRNPDSLVFARLADAYRKAGDPDRALQLLDEGIRRHRDYPSAHIIQARTFIDLERSAEADAAFRHVLELDAQNLVAMRGLAALTEERGDRAEAVEWYERIEALDPLNAEASEALLRLRGGVAAADRRDPDRRDPVGREPVSHEPVSHGLDTLKPTSEEWWSTATPVSPGAGVADARLPADVAEELETMGDELASSLSDESEPEPSELGFDEIALPPAGAGRDPAEFVGDPTAEPDGDSFGSEAESDAELDAEIEAESDVEIDVEIDVEPEGGVPSRGDSDSAAAWWFEDPGDTEPSDDGDLLTRTMADLYARQGLVDEAAAIYRELLVDRPGDPDLERALAGLQEGPEAPADPDPRPRPRPAIPAGSVVDTDVGSESPPERLEAATSSAADGKLPSSGDPYSSHEVPVVAARSEAFLEWLRRLG